MPSVLHLIAGFVMPLGLAFAGTPLAIRVANRFDFYDLPAGYKGHARPTPYLGGAAVAGAFVLGALVVAGHFDRTLPLVGGVLVLFAVGTFDDHRGLSPWPRLSVELMLAAALWALGDGWNLGLGWAPDLLVTLLWIAAVVNAFNLFDNMDGAAGSMAAVAAAGVAGLGVAIGDGWLTLTGAALCGACLGFLPHNMSRPARIFLGDGGSMPVGFAIGALVMSGASTATTEWQALAMGLLFVGIPAVDTAMVMFSRRRRRVPILTGGRDHLTHRMRTRLRTARAVALSLGGAQALLAALALMTIGKGSGALVACVALYLVAAGVLIGIIDAGYETSVPLAPVAAPAGPGEVVRARPRISLGSAAILVSLGVAAGLSPFYAAAYQPTRWAPIGLGLIAVLVAVALARPARPTGPAIAVLAGLGGLGVWALLSSLWAESVEDAVVGGNRLLVLTAFLGVAVLLVRSRRAAEWALGAATVGALAVGVWELAQMLFTDGSGVILVGRLDGPLGYVNGQGCAALLAGLPCLALAERSRPRIAGLAAGAATAAGCLVLLSQSRGAVIAAVAAALVAVAVAPGRLRRIGLIGIVVAGVLAGSHWLLAVYREGSGGGVVPRTTLREAALVTLGASLVTGSAWAAILKVHGMVSGPTRLRAWRAWRTVVVAAAAFGLIAVASTPALGHRLTHRLHEFTNGKPVSAERPASGTRLTIETSNRAEYWRIALRTFAKHPVDGTGAGGYAVPYYRERSSTENVTQPHSLVLQTLAELGLVGGVLLALFVGGIAWGIVRCARAAHRRPSERTIAVASAAIATAWFVHASIDWIHLLPGVTAVALLAVGVLVRPLPRTAAAAAGEADMALARKPNAHLRAGWIPALGAIALVIVVAAVSLGRQTLSDYYRGKADAAVVRDPLEALHQADLALGVDGWATESLYVKAAALSRLHREAQAGRVLQRALAKEPKNFITYVLFGDHLVRLGANTEAQRWYRRALALNPRDRTIKGLATDPGSSGLLPSGP